MLRMHTRTVEVVEGSLIAMIDVCVPKRLGEDGINGRVYMVASQFEWHLTCRCADLVLPQNRVSTWIRCLRCASCVIVRGAEYL